MKKVLKKKLTLLKTTVSNLSNIEMVGVKGGSVFVSGCTACTTEKPECITNSGCVVCPVAI